MDLLCLAINFLDTTGEAKVSSHRQTARPADAIMMKQQSALQNKLQMHTDLQSRLEQGAKPQTVQTYGKATQRSYRLEYKSVLQRTRDFLNFEDFELIAFLDVVEVFQRQAAFETGFDILHVILEAFQGIEFTSPDHHVVTQQAYR